MQTSLRDQCNLDLNAARAVLAQGFLLPTDFLKVKDADIDRLCLHINKNVDNATIPYLGIAYLKTYRYWAVLSKRIGASSAPAAYTPEERTFVEELREERAAWLAVHPKEPDLPVGLKDLARWRTFWERTDSYLSVIHGAAEISLNYVYRPTEAVTAETRAVVYPRSSDLYYNCTLLSGAHYVADNARVFEVLKTLTMDGPGWTFIRTFNRTKDGRGAVMALRLQAEGDSATLTRKERAYKSIETTQYTGPRRNFTFQQYVVKHSDAHSELEECDETMPESRKVSIFLDGISCPRLATGKDIIEGDPTKSASFQSAQSYLSSLIIRKDSTKKRGGGMNERSVSEVQTSKRGGGSGGGGNKGGGKKTSKKGNLTLEDRYYTKEEWFNVLDSDERDIVHTMKNRNSSGKGGKGGRGGGRGRGGDEEIKRRISALETATKIPDDTAPSDDDEDAPPAAFGRNAHKKAKATGAKK